MDSGSLQDSRNQTPRTAKPSGWLRASCKVPYLRRAGDSLYWPSWRLESTATDVKVNKEFMLAQKAYSRAFVKDDEFYYNTTRNRAVFLITVTHVYEVQSKAVGDTYSSLKWTKCISPEKAHPMRRCSDPSSYRLPQWKWKASSTYFPFRPPPDTRGRWRGGGSNFTLRAWPLFSREMLTS